MLLSVVLMSAFVATCYGQIYSPTTTTLSPTTSGVESEDEPQLPQVYRAPQLPTSRRTNVLSTQVRQNAPAPSPQVRGVPQRETYRPYSFNYVAEGEDGMSSREETADGNGRVVGFYTMELEDGRRRRVDYVADEGGFRANVDTNEPGTDSQSPADVVFYSSMGRAAPPSRGIGNALNNEEQRPPRTGGRIPQGRPSASHTHYVDQGHYHQPHSQPLYDDGGSHHYVYRRPIPYYYGNYQHYH